MPSALREERGHRDRLIDAMASSIEEKGYRGTVVADVVRLARTSRRSFYEHFEDRDGCFLALFDAANEDLIGRVAEAAQADRPWEEQVDAAVAAYLDAVSSRPALWQSFLRELPGLGQAGAARRRAAIERFADLLVGLVESSRREQPELGARPLTEDMAIIIVAGLGELVAIASEQRRDVRELRPVAAGSVKAMLSGVLLSRQT